MLLDILIPSLTKRQEHLEALLNELQSQIREGDLSKDIRIIIEVDNGKLTIGQKRNKLMDKAKAKYIWFIDDDDMVFPGAVQKVINGCKADVDVISYNGIMTTNGTGAVPFEIRIGHPYDAIMKRKQHILFRRFPNHISPMKRELAMQVPFENVKAEEDYRFACGVRGKGLLKTEYVIPENVYHYQFRTRK